MKIKILLTCMMLFTAITSVSAQENFKNSHLVMLHNILRNSSKSTVNDLLKTYDYKFNNSKTEDGEESLHFRDKDQTKAVSVHLNKSAKIEGATLILPNNELPNLITELKRLNYKSSDGEDSSLNWEKSGSDIWFITLEADPQTNMSAITMVQDM